MYFDLFSPSLLALKFFSHRPIRKKGLSGLKNMPRALKNPVRSGAVPDEDLGFLGAFP
jgi:hypothetical protein